jgi:hypothetical protein
MSRHTISESLTFRLHANIVNTEPVGSCSYDDHIPQHLTFFGRLTGGAGCIDPFRFYFRCRTIQSVVFHHADNTSSK